MQRTKHARKATFLSQICSDAGACIAFGGPLSSEIKQFFNGFTKFDYVAQFQRTGNSSGNGFVHSIKYTHRGYSAYALLKSAASPVSDNLMYEYEIGQRINTEFYNRFPIFVETYDTYYTYKNEDSWLDFRSKHSPAPNPTQQLRNALTPHHNLDYKLACSKSKYLCILIQHIDRAPNIGAMCEDSLAFVQNELLNSLYQIYFTLSAMKNVFTHYDLHHENVLIYTPNETKFITYHFHSANGEIITFNSRHMVKIIDYGRSYMHETTEYIKKKVCSEPACSPTCGKSFGYAEGINKKRNMSEDLRLLHVIIPMYLSDQARYKRPPVIEAVLFNELNNKVIASMTEITEPRLPRIGNVSDAEKEFKRLLKMDIFKEQNKRYSAAYTKMGDLHVYTDRNMEYISG